MPYKEGLFYLEDLRQVHDGWSQYSPISGTVQNQYSDCICVVTQDIGCNRPISKQPTNDRHCRSWRHLHPLSFKGNEPPDRESRKRGEAASNPGISKEQVCVSCAVDRTAQFFSRVSTLGRPSAKTIHRVLKRRLLNDAILCTDKDRAYVKFAAKNNFEHVPLKGGTARLGVYHVQNVNAYHSRLKHFLRRFKGVSTKYLNNYLVWNNAIQEGGRSRITLLKLCMKAMVFTRWHGISCRPAVQIWDNAQDKITIYLFCIVNASLR